MFESTEMAPPDAILGLSEAFKKDPNPAKINLGVGVYKDSEGRTPVMDCVKRAERVILEKEDTKGYLSIWGSSEYSAVVQELVLGKDSRIAADGRVLTAQTPGGTGALRVAADLVCRLFPSKRIWVSDPTWGNHPQVFRAAGLDPQPYPYYDRESKTLDFDAMVAALESVGQGEAVLLHGCCHNPTGMDLTADQWARVANVAADRKWVPLVDFAYQGLAGGIDADAQGLRTLAGAVPEMLVANSFSKNFGLYRERVGGLTIMGGTPEAAAKAMSHAEKCIRANYSNPPSHGGSVVVTIMNDPDLRRLWEEEVTAIRERINGMRKLFVETLAAKGVARDFSFITRQRGMFSFAGINKDQVAALRNKYSIYVVDSGRINVAGMTRKNMDALCEAMAEVLKT